MNQILFFMTIIIEIFAFKYLHKKIDNLGEIIHEKTNIAMPMNLIYEKKNLRRTIH